eukprot:871475-Prorocentrum_minimum.AAC.1
MAGFLTFPDVARSRSDARPDFRSGRSETDYSVLYWDLGGDPPAGGPGSREGGRATSRNLRVYFYFYFYFKRIPASRQAEPGFS